MDRANRDERFPDRRKRILEKLAELWERYPDQRLSQLVYNIERIGDQTLDPHASLSRIYNMEDDVFERNLSEAVASGFWDEN